MADKLRRLGVPGFDENLDAEDAPQPYYYLYSTAKKLTEIEKGKDGQHDTWWYKYILNGTFVQRAAWGKVLELAKEVLDADPLDGTSPGRRQVGYR